MPNRGQKRTVEVLIVDDHPLFRTGLAELITSREGLSVCGQTGEASAAMSLLASREPALVTVDLSLAQGSGLELIKQIRAVRPGVKILVCSMHDERIFAERALKAGADGYLNKEEPPSTILQAIVRVLDGKIYLSEPMAERLLKQRLHGRRDDSDQIEDILSSRELEVFDLIGSGFSTRKIAEKLQLSVKTIETHQDHIKTKLGAE
ncbi:response regulator transcription factor, partial [Candidatus Sumerlaeota bacterium]|nr:response regulator transcription factor [Candidatus Sumerlaeota bacterium]